jgi:hypothetical protein
MSEVYLKYVWSVSGVRLEYVWSVTVSEVCLKYV